MPCDEKYGLLEVLRQGDLNLIPFDPDGTAGEGDLRILRSFAGVYVETPSVPRTLDDRAIQMTFSERSSRMRTGVVDGVERSVDIKECNPSPVDFNGPSSPRRNLFYRCDVDKFRHDADPSFSLDCRGNTCNL
jgi:hypothetical protein